MHFFYRYPEDSRVGNRTRVLGRKLDIRGEGGLVVGPPSMHLETGKLYQWTSPIEGVSLDEVPVFRPRWIEPMKTESKPNVLEQSTQKCVTGTGIASLEHQ